VISGDFMADPRHRMSSQYNALKLLAGTITCRGGH